MWRKTWAMGGLEHDLHSWWVFIHIKLLVIHDGDQRWDFKHQIRWTGEATITKLVRHGGVSQELPKSRYYTNCYNRRHKVSKEDLGYVRSSVYYEMYWHVLYYTVYFEIFCFIYHVTIEYRTIHNNTAYLFAQTIQPDFSFLLGPSWSPRPARNITGWQKRVSSNLA